MTVTMCALLSLAASFVICLEIASATPHVDLYIRNVSQVEAIHNPSLLRSFPEIRPGLKTMKAENTVKREASSLVADISACKVTYNLDYKRPSFLLARQHSQTCRNGAGLCKIAWNRFPVGTEPGEADCCGLMTHADHAHVVARRHDGRFGAGSTSDWSHR